MPETLSSPETSQRRVAVTGVGLVCALGVGADHVWNAILGRARGVQRIASFDTSRFRCQIAGEARDFNADEYIDRKEVRRMARFIQFAIVASECAVRFARIDVNADNAVRCGVYIGSAMGGFDVIERERHTYVQHGPRRISPFLIPASTVSSASGYVSIRFGTKGPVSAVSCGSSSGAFAIGESFKMIQRGDADMMICGGSEACITQLVLGGFDAMRILSRRNEDPECASRPFDAMRDGFVIGEGSGILILEEMESARRRSGRILAELVGFGMSSNAAEVGHSVSGARRSILNALRDARIRPDQVNYISAHGTSTPEGDAAETQAVKECFTGSAHRLSISSTKAATGYLLGAASAFDAGIAVLSLRDQTAPPTMNHQRADRECDLDFVPNYPRAVQMEYALSNSFGFDGTNACLVFRAAH